MMRAVKNSIRIVAAGLLMLVMAVLLPRELYHHHDHHSEAEHTNHARSGFTNAEDDCPICDFQLLPFTFSLEGPEVFTLIHSGEQVLLKPFTPDTEAISGFSGRAPPAIFS